MKKYKLLICSAAIFMGMACAGALEFGAIAMDSTNFKFDANKYSKPILEQKESLNVSAKQSLSKDGLTYIAAEGMFSHTLDKTLAPYETAENTFIADCSLFKVASVLKINENAKVDFSAGRFFIVDASGLVFTQNSDGARISVNFPSAVISAYAGYTGLLNKKNVKILQTSGALYEVKKEEDVYDFAAPYFIPMLSLSLPYVAFNQTVSIEGSCAVPTEGPNKLHDHDTRAYLTGNLTGPLASSLFYNITETFSFTKEHFGSLSQFGLTYFMDFLSSSISLNSLYASNNFKGFSQQTTTDSCNDLGLAAIFKGGASVSLVPVSVILLKLGADVVMNTQNGFDYYGWQFDGLADIHVFSDFSLNIGASIFAADKKDNNRVKISWGASLAL